MQAMLLTSGDLFLAFGYVVQILAVDRLSNMLLGLSSWTTLRRIVALSYFLLGIGDFGDRL